MSHAKDMMHRSFVTSAVLLLPPVRRAQAALASLRSSIDALGTEQRRMAHELSGISARAAGLAAVEGALNSLAAGELQRAALRNLPFLLGEFRADSQSIEIHGYAGAPEGLTKNMAFFINGQRFNEVDYPIPDPELHAKFSEVRGGGPTVRARATTGLAELQEARWFRFDAAATGVYVEARWRQAVHLLNPAHEACPFPPTRNMYRVVGESHVTRFASGGATIFKNLEAYLRELGQSWQDVPRILDWGCGAGRLTRYLLSDTPSLVTGADIDADNIAWCRSNLPRGQFEVVPLMPPTAFADASFDMVVGLSVMTHLKEDVQFAWLLELQRITRPGGLVFLSVQGPTQFAYNSFPPGLYRKLQDVGFMDLAADPALAAVIEDGDYYRASMHSRPYIIDRWGEYFDVIAFEDAIAALQDFVVMRRRA